MLDAELKTRLAAYLERLAHPIELVATLDDGEASARMRALLADIADASLKVAVLERRDDGARVPSFGIRRAATAPGGVETAEARVHFAGLPLGHEFTSLVLALLQVGGHPPKITAEQHAAIAALDANLRFETWISLSCQNCPDVVQALNLMSTINPRISVTTIDGALFQSEAEANGIMSLPTVLLNGAPFAQGRMGLEQILEKLDAGAAARTVDQLREQAPFDVLIVGGGPAGAAAGVYAARKGIRTGLVAERFGGQVLDTLAIENFVSVRHTEGPAFAAALEAHVREYDVRVFDGQRAIALEPPTADEPLARVRLASGATLSARSVILAPGARWRQLGVPGEDEYRNRGVAYCPHCDGPLYKGRRVAVVGGGNSGVEAAIDLAGIAAQVTLIEFDDALRADAVLVARLRSLPNVTIVTGARTTAIDGDGKRVEGLVYERRADGSAHRIALDGVFVQIGLVPNTEWLGDTVALSRHREIVVGPRGDTSVPGIFAAGDATTVPFKQIVIAAGDGARSALGAFDHLIRTPVGSVASASGPAAPASASASASAAPASPASNPVAQPA
ncbi:MAG: alkyl hydroperoxide reductase subunit F [Lautropia sp.]